MSNLNTLYSEELAPISLFLLGSNNITWLLKPGSHKVQIPQALIQAQSTCGLIPLGAPCIVSTSGLKWNLGKRYNCRKESNISKATLVNDKNKASIFIQLKYFILCVVYKFKYFCCFTNYPFLSGCTVFQGDDGLKVVILLTMLFSFLLSSSSLLLSLFLNKIPK